MKFMQESAHEVEEKMIWGQVPVADPSVGVIAGELRV